MQFFAILALVSVAVASPARRQLPGVNGTSIGECTRFAAPRTCSVDGNRIASCLEYNPVCPFSWKGVSNNTDVVLSQESCVGKEYGDKCTAYFTCCPDN